MYYRGINISSIADKKERSRVRKIQNKLRLEKTAIRDEIIGQALW